MKNPVYLALTTIFLSAVAAGYVAYTSSAFVVLPPFVLFCGLILSALIYRVASVDLRRREVDERYRSLVDQSMLAFQVLDSESRVIRVNRAWEELWGATLEDLKDYRMLRDKQLKEKGVLPHIQKAFAGEASELPVVPYRPKLGRYRDRDIWVRGLVYPLKDAEGQVREVVLIQENITDLKNIEQELRRSHEELEHRVAVRTAELREANAALVQEMEERSKTESALLQSRKIEAIGRLAGGVAHDFNNLITAITGISQEIINTFPAQDPRIAEMQDIIKAADKASALTRQLLAFGRRQVSAPQVLRLDTLVTEMQKMLSRVIGEDIQCETRHDETPSAIRADRSQIEQVILNLVLNARDALPHGGKLWLETKRVGEAACLTVKDNGLGMDADTRAKIFEPYFTTKPGGTGLGLATVYGIVKQNGGEITVDSEPGEGTSFNISFPIVTETVAAEAPAPSAAPSRGSETILVVEDEPIVRRVVTKALARAGYRVLEAGDGVEALSLAASHDGPIDLALTDVVMPRMNGRDMARQLLLARPSVRVLYMSGYAEDVIVKRGILEAGIAFIEKSFTPDSLNRKVREVLDSPTRPAGTNGPRF